MNDIYIYRDNNNDVNCEHKLYLHLHVQCSKPLFMNNYNMGYTIPNIHVHEEWQQPLFFGSRCVLEATPKKM